MEIFNYLKPYLDNLLKEYSNNFEYLFEKVQDEYKNEIKKLILYLDKLLNVILTKENNKIDVLHIHFGYTINDIQKKIIAEYILIKLFFYYNSIDNIDNENQVLSKIISNLSTEKKMLTQCPEGATLSPKKNKAGRVWLEKKEINKSRLSFYGQLIENSSLIVKSLLNIPIKICQSLSNTIEKKPYAFDLDSQYRSYNLLNTNRTLNDIDNTNNNIINNLDSVILFDCEEKKTMTDFSYNNLNVWNNQYHTNFRKLLIITFGNNTYTLNSINKKIDTIKNRFQIPENSSYTILNSEIDYLLDKDNYRAVNVKFTGIETSPTWNEFIDLLNSNDLYELRSFKMINIYSLCINKKIKAYIINDLFIDYSELLSNNTKEKMKEIDEETLEKIKKLLSETLDLIINSDLKNKINEELENSETIILDKAIIEKDQLISLYIEEFKFKKNKLKSWLDLDSVISTNILILSYRDQGIYPNYFYPNIHELKFENKINAKAIYTKFLFQYNYNKSNYNLLKDYYNHLLHPIRNKYFEWQTLYKKINEFKPENEININWDLEYEYSKYVQRDGLKITYQNGDERIILNSNFLIICNKENNIRLERAKLVFENNELDIKEYKIQLLDELLVEFNPAEKMIDTTRQNEELNIIRKTLKLENESAGRIWKILLKRQAEIIGHEILYKELTELFNKQSITLVSYNHFENSWINLECDSLMPRGNKVFKVLCDYLGLNKNYRLILYNIKNTLKSGRRYATRIYSKLLKDLFDDKCFDDNILLKDILEHKIEDYISNHNLDEMSIDNENPINGLIALIELIKPEFKLLPVKTIQIYNYE